MTYIWPISGLYLRLYVRGTGGGKTCKKTACRAVPQISNLEFFCTRHVDSILAITLDHDLQMTRNWYHSKALVEAHLFRGVSSQSKHFPKIAFLARYGQSEPPFILILSSMCATFRRPTRAPSVPSHTSMKKLRNYSKYMANIWPYMAIYGRIYGHIYMAIYGHI